MKHLIKLLLTAIVVSILLSMPTFASENIIDYDPIKEFTGLFELEDSDLTYIPEYRALLIDNVSLDISSIEGVQINNNKFVDFEFTSGLFYRKLSSFSCEKNLTGQGLEGMRVGLLVYTYNEAGEKELVEHKTKTLGASGLYSELVCFAPNTKQYLVVVINHGNKSQSRVFEVTTKEEETRSILENINLQFIPEVKEDIVIEPFFEWSDLIDFDF